LRANLSGNSNWDLPGLLVADLLGDSVADSVSDSAGDGGTLGNRPLMALGVWDHPWGLNRHLLAGTVDHSMAPGGRGNSSSVMGSSGIGRGQKVSIGLRFSLSLGLTLVDSSGKDWGWEAMGSGHACNWVCQASCQSGQGKASMGQARVGNTSMGNWGSNGLDSNVTMNSNKGCLFTHLGLDILALFDQSSFHNGLWGVDTLLNVVSGALLFRDGFGHGVAHLL